MRVRCWFAVMPLDRTRYKRTNEGTINSLLFDFGIHGIWASFLCNPLHPSAIRNQEDVKQQLTGIDIDTSMINEARKKISHKNVSFHYQRVNEKLEFTDNEFDAVTFCSVLFLLDDTTKAFLFNEALRVLKPDGKIIVLTPSGKKMIISSFVEVWKYPYSSTNWTFIVWKTLTTKGARKWNRSEWLKRFSKQKNLKYTGEITFTKNATIEIITK